MSDVTNEAWAETGHYQIVCTREASLVAGGECYLAGDYCELETMNIKTLFRSDAADDPVPSVPYVPETANSMTLAELLQGPRRDHLEVVIPLNPKDAEAQTKGKVRLDLLEPAANESTANALAFGADKYGVRNYATIPIELRVYLAAIQRHLDALKRGEDFAEDSGVSHWGHIGANVHVVEAALEAGTAVDDRKASRPKDIPFNNSREDRS